MANTDLKVQIQFEALGEESLIQAFKGVGAAQQQLVDSQKRSNKQGLLTTKNNRLQTNTFATLRSKILLASFAVGLYGSSLGRLAKLAGEQREAELKLETAIGGTSQALVDQANALQILTGFGDEEILMAQATLAQYVREEAKIIELTKATLDFAAAKGMDLKAASELVGKSVGTSTNALMRYGVTVEGATGGQDRFNTAMEGLTKKGILGQAETRMGSFSVRMEASKGIMGDVAQVIGAKMIPFMTKILDAFDAWGRRLQTSSKSMLKFKIAMKLLGVAVLFMLKPIQLIWKGLKAFGGMIATVAPFVEILTYTIAAAALVSANFAKVLVKLIQGDFKGAKDAFNETAKTIEDYKNGVDIGTEATDKFGKGMKFLDGMTLGLAGDFNELVNAEDEYTGAVVDNKNELDDANAKLKERALLLFVLKNATSDLAAKQLMLNSNTLAGENENKAFIKTLGQFNAKVKENILVTEVKSMADLEAYIQKNFQNKEEAEDLRNIFQRQHELNQINASGAISNRKATEERQKGVFEMASAMKGLIGDSKMAALVGLRIQQAQAIAGAYLSFVNYNAMIPPRPVLAKMALATGLFSAAAIEKQQGKVSSAAFGADFIADSPQFVKVGDNPQMRERVTVTPIGSPNVRGSGGGSEVVINLNGNILGTEEFVRDTLIPQLENSLGRNLA
tara:strand:+ start:2918 stop:4957 length:2040 start_codon:yes stop_codon:yes gene_type:complete